VVEPFSLVGFGIPVTLEKAVRLVDIIAQAVV
jgi:hypothetical protein